MVSMRKYLVSVLIFISIFCFGFNKAQALTSQDIDFLVSLGFIDSNVASYVKTVLGLVKPTTTAVTTVSTTPATSGSYCLYLKNNMTLGSRDSDTSGEVTLLQDYLRENGFLNSESTGYYGQLTKNAVIAFQKKYGVSQTGYTGLYTRSKIREISCKNAEPIVAVKTTSTSTSTKTSTSTSTATTTTTTTKTATLTTSSIVMGGGGGGGGGGGSSVVTTPIPTKANLAPGTISYSPTTITEGDSVTFSASISNSGETNAGVSNIKWYVDDVESKYSSSSAVSAGSTFSSTSLNFVWTSVSGTHTIKLCVDANNSVDESNESNNCGTVDVTVESVPEATTNTLNVLVIRYFPLVSGATSSDPNALIDITKTGDWAPTLSVGRAHMQNIEDSLVELKTDGSRYHGFNDSSISPYITYNIIERKEHFTDYPLVTSMLPTRRINEPQMLLNDNICHYVDDHGVKEVWLWANLPGMTGHSESRMAPASGSGSEVANGGGLTLPVCGHTYILYNFNPGRGLGEAMESTQHQIEVEWNYFGTISGGGNLFQMFLTGSLMSHFVKDTYNLNSCGWAHAGPNNDDPFGTENYVWNKTTEVSNQCEDWHPDGSGEKTIISCSKWGCTQNGFQRWWMQNVPGEGNDLYFNGKKMINLWDVILDYDSAYQTYNHSLVIDSTIPSSVSTITSDDSQTIELSYNSESEEDALTATFNVSIFAGSQDLYIYKNGLNVTFRDSDSNQTTVSATITPQVNVGFVRDQSGSPMYSIPARQIKQFSISASVDPRGLKHGNYSATIANSTMTVNRNSNSSTNFTINIPSIVTGTQEVFGQISPYINSVSSVASSSGNVITISGERLQDCVLYNWSGDYSDLSILSDGTQMSFITTVSNGTYSIQVENATNGLSNTAEVTIGGITSNKNVNVATVLEATRILEEFVKLLRGR